MRTRLLVATFATFLAATPVFGCGSSGDPAIGVLTDPETNPTLPNGSWTPSMSLVGEDFSQIIRGCGMGGASQATKGFYDSATQQFKGFPWNGQQGAPEQTAYQTLAAHGVNYVRIPIGYAPPPDAHGFVWNDLADDLRKAALIRGVNPGPNGERLKLELDVLYTDNLTSDLCDGVPQGAPAAWQADLDEATKNNPTYQIGTNASGTYDTNPLEKDVYQYTYDLLTAFAQNGTPVNLVSIGNEIESGFAGVPMTTRTCTSSGADVTIRKFPLFYQLVYQGIKAVRDWDAANHPSTPTGTLLHLIGVGMSTSQEAEYLTDPRGNGIPITISPSQYTFDALGFSFHGWDNSLDFLKQAFWAENLGQYGKYLFVQETAYTYLPDSATETVNGTVFTHIAHDFKDQSVDSYSPKGQHDYLETVISNSGMAASGLGVGALEWAADDVVNWGRTPVGEHNLALWRSDDGTLVTDPSTGTASLSAFRHLLFFDNFQEQRFDKPSKWHALQGSWSVASLDGGLVLEQASTAGGSAAAGSAGWANYTVQADVTPLSFDATGAYVGVGLRYVDANNHYQARIGRSACKITKMVNGQESILTQGNFDAAAGKTYTVALEANGKTLTLYVNGTERLQVNDASLSAGGIELIASAATAGFNDVSARSQ